ncbi:hypothetical protein AB0M44_22535 [Streptosporangium subroseum]|uniref:hypothetical protein n=1 Tax=Streptosporangium subroseum TaxID=106412 RepID=UPI0034397C3E
MIRVLLADDQTLIRAGFRALLKAEDDLEVDASGRRTGAHRSLARRLALHARQRRPQLTGVHVRCHGQFGYVEGELAGGERGEDGPGRDQWLSRRCS